MNATRWLRLACLALLLCLCHQTVLTSQEPIKPAAAPPAARKTSAPGRELGLLDASTTHHTIVLEGKPLRYTATAARLSIADDSGKPEAEMFFVAYFKEPEDNPSRRPIAFAFNGGPGASAMWLHLGGIGPKRVPLAEDGTAVPQGYPLGDNPCTWLAFTDLVFVDPVGTGYSRAAAGTDAKKFYGLEGDARASASFVRRFLTCWDRWRSPKYLVGESYGTTRAASLASKLETNEGISIDGLVLISSALDFKTFSDQGNDLACALRLPSYTAAAWYHKRLPAGSPKKLEDAASQSAQWALGEYLTALAQGDRLPDAARTQLAERLSALTGLPKDQIERENLRIGAGEFRRRLLQDQHRLVGQLDARVTSPAPHLPWAEEGLDPAFQVTIAPYLAALHDYLRRELQFHSDAAYQFFSGKANEAWDWGSALHGYVDVTGNLKEALAANPRLRVLMVAGYYDLTTPYLSQRYTLDHLGLPKPLRGNLTFQLYPTGHQIYTSTAALQSLSRNAAKFFGSSGFSCKTREIPPSGR
jgi:carboxypeptidase C (cathepsin A)